MSGFLLIQACQVAHTNLVLAEPELLFSLSKDSFTDNINADRNAVLQKWNQIFISGDGQKAGESACQTIK